MLHFLPSCFLPSFLSSLLSLFLLLSGAFCFVVSNLSFAAPSGSCFLCADCFFPACLTLLYSVLLSFFAVSSSALCFLTFFLLQIPCSSALLPPCFAASSRFLLFLSPSSVFCCSSPYPFFFCLTLKKALRLARFQDDLTGLLKCCGLPKLCTSH